jgi:BioD-like phosphotransacetylase family protein
MKPVRRATRCIPGQCLDEDAAFVKEIFDLKEPLSALAPICVDYLAIQDTMKGAGPDYVKALKQAYAKVSQDKDVVLLEGGDALEEGFVIGLPTYKVSRLLQAKDLLIIKWGNCQQVDYMLAAKELLGDSLLGVVINAVPRREMAVVNDVVVPYLQDHGVKVYAVLPLERILRSVSVRELSEIVNGQVLCCEDALDELVEHLMVGAMSGDSALSHFRRKPNKAVITGGDRPDIQLAALETSTKCMILTGNLQPSPLILGRAEEMGVPMILVRKDTLSTVEVAEEAFYQSRFQDNRKIARFDRIMEENFDFAGLYADLGLK